MQLGVDVCIAEDTSVPLLILVALHAVGFAMDGSGRRAWTFTDLLHHIHDAPGIERIRFATSHPRYLYIVHLSHACDSACIYSCTARCLATLHLGELHAFKLHVRQWRVVNGLAGISQNVWYGLAQSCPRCANFSTL